MLHSWEVRDDFAAIARRNVEAFFGGPHPAWKLRVGDVADSLETGYDRIVLDMLAPWEMIDLLERALEPGGVFVGYVATTPQLSELVEALRANGGFTEPRAWETLVRDWHADGLAVRPDHRMIAHTAFLITSRKLAPGVTAPPRRRKPSKGAEAYSARRAAGAAGRLAEDSSGSVGSSGSSGSVGSSGSSGSSVGSASSSEPPSGGTSPARGGSPDRAVAPTPTTPEDQATQDR
jgi:tRNA (adenine57-N1/adenine58-N1)-methyltransferase